MTLLLGCDFTSRPRRQKPITIATGFLEPTTRGGAPTLVLENLLSFCSQDQWVEFLSGHDNWVGGFDFPFGLPSALVHALGWPTDWPTLMHYYLGLSRADIRQVFQQFCNARPAGQKFAHRATDWVAQSSPSMKWVNPPVAYMMHAGVRGLLDAGATLVGLHDAHPSRIALEAYPGFLARQYLGRRSYKSDNKSTQTDQRLQARIDLTHALMQPVVSLGLQVKATPSQWLAMQEDASGDTIDAVLCLLQAAWAMSQHTNGHTAYGLRLPVDPIEGWIVTT